MTEPIYCARCEITLGDGQDKCRRAKDSDICISCAFEMDPPVEEENMRGGPIDESPGYRDAMNDAGRGHLLR